MIKNKKYLTAKFPRSLMGYDRCIVSQEIIQATDTPVTYQGKTIGKIKRIYRENGDFCFVIELDSMELSKKDYDSIITSVGVI